MRVLVNVLLVWLLVGLSASGCNFGSGDKIKGSGTISERTFDVRDFSAVRFTTGGNLKITLGNTEALSLQTDDNLLKYYEAEVDGKTLVISRKPNLNPQPSRRINFELAVKTLDQIVNSGSGDIELAAQETESFEIQVSGSGEVEIGELGVKDLAIRLTGSGAVEVGDLKAREVAVHISGSGDVELAGENTEYQNVKLTGSGDYEARRLPTARVKVMVSGSGSAMLHVTGSLEATLSGSGDILYKGEPEVEKTESGSGEVQSI